MDDLFANIVEAHTAIRPHVRYTPLDRSPALSVLTGCDVWLKCEHTQPTGSFKVRGATNKIRKLGEQARSRGVITASTGNHGQAAAHAGSIAGVAVTVYVSASTAPVKIEAIEARGGRVVIVDGPAIDAELQARQAAAAQDIPYISPYNDRDVMAGQGTLGMELVEQAPDLDAVFISVGGGGLIGGTGTAFKQKGSRARIIDVAESPTLSDGTAGAVEPGSVTFPVCQSVIDDTVTVTEAEIAAALRHIATAEHWIVEGAAAVALAGLIKRASAWRDRKVAVVLCGRNIALEQFLAVICNNRQP
jgi:threonine dehydratase